MFTNDQEEFYYLNRDKFPEDFRTAMEKFRELKEIFFETEPAFYNTINPPLLRLMALQFPELGNNTDRQHKKYMAEINRLFAFGLIWKMFFLLQDQKDNIDPIAKYPKLESWRAFYWKPAEPELVTDTWRQPLIHKTEQEWQQYKEKENKKIVAYHLEKQARQQAFYDIVQPLIFDTLPDLQNIEGDYWVLYATILGDEYDQWNSFCGRIETTIKYQFPADSFYWTNEDFHTALVEKMQ